MGERPHVGENASGEAAILMLRPLNCQKSRPDVFGAAWITVAKRKRRGILPQRTQSADTEVTEGCSLDEATNQTASIMDLVYSG